MLSTNSVQLKRSVLNLKDRCWKQKELPELVGCVVAWGGPCHVQMTRTNLSLRRDSRRRRSSAACHVSKPSFFSKFYLTPTRDRDIQHPPLARPLHQKTLTTEKHVRFDHSGPVSPPTDEPIALRFGSCERRGSRPLMEVPRFPLLAVICSHSASLLLLTLLLHLTHAGVELSSSRPTREETEAKADA